LCVHISFVVLKRRVLAATRGVSLWLDKSQGRKQGRCDRRTDVSFYWMWRPLFYRWV